MNETLDAPPTPWTLPVAWQRLRACARRLPWRLVALWLALRLGLSLWAALISQFRPLTPIEQRLALWPPAAPWSAWLERVLLAPWQRWDVPYYLAIVERGYRRDDGTAQFHPLLAWLAAPLTWLGLSPLLALLLVSSAATLALLIVLERLARLDLPPERARLAPLLLLAFPPAFVLFAPYTESLWLLWAVLCLWWARRRRWWLAGLAGGLATLTRQQGLFLLLPLAWELWAASERRWRVALARWRSWLALAPIPLAMLLWLVYRALALGDLRADWSSPQALIYSVLISPSASKVVPQQAFVPPWMALAHALARLAHAPLDIGTDLALGLFFLLLTALAWPCLRGGDRWLVAALVLVSFSYYTGPFYPYMGLPRHLLLAVPVFIGLAARLKPQRVARVLLPGLAGLLWLTMLYVLEAWVP
ncbi:glycosyltransferase 87 family protein [Kallotenue papyrolyticum]|uniref:glycosyltransferase 87 family protein n=1 Tax=Kallotenue papyrolyticum TaxID=1325125 RepID=UPI00047867D8|nr:glycosyltransferase 87 family protein [Kallotenue papyrolyticum]